MTPHAWWDLVARDASNFSHGLAQPIYALGDPQELLWHLWLKSSTGLYWNNLAYSFRNP